jgi:hypothetical protein
VRSSSRRNAVDATVEGEGNKGLVVGRKEHRDDREREGLSS